MSIASEDVAHVQNPRGANFRLTDVPDDIEYQPVGLVSSDNAPSRGMFYQRRGTRPAVGVHLMHPRTDQSQNYNILPLAAAGYAVLGRASRWPNNDVSTVHEHLLLDVAAGVRYLREERGCEVVILLGNSGGGSLAAFYQAQATAMPGSRVTHTPAGDALDLNQEDLPQVDGLVLLAAHIGQGKLLGKMIDAAVVDEDDPLASDPTLDIYDPANGYRIAPDSTSYSPEFLARVTEAQSARVRRIDAKAYRLIATGRDAAAALGSAQGVSALRLERTSLLGWHMVVYRTTADPAFVDLTIDPDDRVVFSYFSARPDRENFGEAGFARCVTPRAWLSTWSALSSNASTIDNLKKCRQPLLIVHYAGDAATRISEVEEMYAQSGAADKDLEIIRNIDHYGFPVSGGGSKVRSSAGVEKVVSWLSGRFPA